MSLNHRGKYRTSGEYLETLLTSWNYSATARWLPKSAF